MRIRVALCSALAIGTVGAFAGPAAADPAATLCGSVKVTVNGQALVDQAQCQVLPPSQ